MPTIAIASASTTSVTSSMNQTGLRNELNTSEQSLASIGGDTLVKNSPTDTTTTLNVRDDIIKYRVKSNETLTDIANKFNVDVATILQENKIFADDIVKSGQTISILPVSGATERVDQGETLSQIASKHGVGQDKIMQYNNLLTPADIEYAQILVVPDGNRSDYLGARPRPRTEPTVVATADTSSSSSSSSVSSTSSSTSSTPTVNRGASVGNRFPWGYCTWYVASRRGDVSWRGNAKEWLYNAQAQGRATGRTPAVGSIMVTTESWWGHVAYVEAVHGDSVTISEMNYKGHGVKSSRTISNSSGRIRGYIY